jgi:hypothetical protein
MIKNRSIMKKYCMFVEALIAEKINLLGKKSVMLLSNLGSLLALGQVLLKGGKT